MLAFARRAFTLIELLIVVAIIAILAAIAVPNFLEAQTRSKVSRVHADMRTLDTGLTSYYVDYNTYPACHIQAVVLRPTSGAKEILERLTSPVSYLTQAAYRDPFLVANRLFAADAAGQAAETPTPVLATDPAGKLNSYLYQSCGPEGRTLADPDSFSPVPWSPKASTFFLHSAGPDTVYNNLGGILASDYTKDAPILLIYDATNGTVSNGSIFRVNGTTQAGQFYAGGKGLADAIRASGR